MKQQQAEATVSAGVAERARSTRELIGELKAIRQELEELRPQRETGHRRHRTRDGAICDACDALEARELEIRNEIRKLEGKRPMVPVERRTFLGRSYTEVVEQAEGSETEQDRAGSEDK